MGGVEQGPEGTHKLTLFGYDQEALDKAKGQVDFSAIIIPITGDNNRVYQWLRDRCKVSTLAKSCGSVSINLVDGGVSIKGKTSDVEEAKAAVESHMAYFQKYQTLEQAREEANAALDKISRGMGKRPAGGGGGGGAKTSQKN